MAGELIVERFRSEIALGATAVFRESPMEVPRQPLGYERRDNCVDIADCERRARSFGLVAIDAKHGWQYEFDTRQLQVFGAQSLHAPPPLPPAIRRGRRCATGRGDRPTGPKRLIGGARQSSACRSIFPVPVLGNSGRNSTKRGYLYGTSFCLA